MKILFVTPFLPSPPRFGAERRLDGLARQLALRHEVSLLWFNADHAPIPATLAERHPYCREVSTTPIRPSKASDRRWLQLRSLASTQSFEALQTARRTDFQQALDRMLQAQRYDVVQFESAQLANFSFVKHPGESPVFVLDEHNIEHDLLRRTANAARSPLRRAYGALNWRKIRREERAAWQRFDGVALTSARDQAQLLREVPKCVTSVVPNGVDLAAFPAALGDGEPGVLLFFGALNYFPNQHGLLQFIDQILPEIIRRNPHVTLHVVGPGAPESIRRRQGPGVRIVGEVEDISPYLERAAAVVVPVQIGGGTRLKIIEALAKGRPVISTTVGAEGLNVVNERHLLLADRPDDFARQVARVLDSRELATRLGTAGRRLVQEHYDWRQIASDLEQFYVRLRATSAA